MTLKKQLVLFFREKLFQMPVISFHKCAGCHPEARDNFHKIFLKKKTKQNKIGTAFTMHLFLWHIGKKLKFLFSIVFQAWVLYVQKANYQLRESCSKLVSYLKFYHWQEMVPGQCSMEFCIDDIMKQGLFQSHNAPSCIQTNSLQNLGVLPNLLKSSGCLTVWPTVPYTNFQGSPGKINFRNSQFS